MWREGPHTRGFKAANVPCNKCKKVGHYAKFCKARNISNGEHVKTEKLNLKGLKAMRTGLNTDIVRSSRELKDQLRQRPSVKLPNEEFKKST